MIAKKRKKKKLLVLKCLLAARWIENPFVRIFKIFYSYLFTIFFLREQVPLFREQSQSHSHLKAKAYT